MKGSPPVGPAGYIAQAAFHSGDMTRVNIESIVIAALGAIVVLFLTFASVLSTVGGRGERIWARHSQVPDRGRGLGRRWQRWRAAGPC